MKIVNAHTGLTSNIYKMGCVHDDMNFASGLFQD